MWQAFVVWLSKLFGRTSPTTNGIVRTPLEAKAMRTAAFVALNNHESGAIVCPWCNRSNDTTCTFAYRGFRCSICARSGSIETLRGRLNDAGTYERAIE